MLKLTRVAAQLHAQATQPAKPLPSLWFFSDENRIPDPEKAIALLPPGAGVVYRDYGRSDREIVGEKLRRIAKIRRLVFLVGADEHLAIRLNADGVHWPRWALHRRRSGSMVHKRIWLETQSAHCLRDVVAAKKANKDLVFLSPILPTKSHPGETALGVVRAQSLTTQIQIPTIALGGITAETAIRIPKTQFAGLAAIGAFVS